MLVAAVAAVLICTAAMLAVFGRVAEDRLDDRVEKVNRDFDASLNRFREEVRREFNGRVAPPVPTPTPFTDPVPTPTPEGEGAVTPTPTPSVDDTVPTPDPGGELRP